MFANADHHSAAAIHYLRPAVQPAHLGSVLQFGSLFVFISEQLFAASAAAGGGGDGQLLAGCRCTSHANNPVGKTCVASRAHNKIAVNSGIASSSSLGCRATTTIFRRCRRQVSDSTEYRPAALPIPCRAVGKDATPFSRVARTVGQLCRC